MSRWKFDDCATCANRRKRHICRDCEVGEFYEDEDEPTVDRVFYERPTRFGDSVTTDYEEDEAKQLDAAAMLSEAADEDNNDESA